MIALFYLHGIAKGSGGSWDDRDLLYRCGMGLQGCNHGMSDLMVGYCPFFLVCQDRILLLVTGDNNLYAFLKV